MCLTCGLAQEAPRPPEPLQFDPATAGDPLGSFRLSHQDRVIEVQQFAPQAEGGQFRTNVPNCEPGLRMSTVFAPAPYMVVTRVAETSIVSQVVLARRPEQREPGAEAESQEPPAGDTLNMFAGSVAVDEVFCPTETVRSGAEEVYIIQGRTLISGTELLYDNATGLAELDGPVSLLRQADGEGPEIVASSESLSFDVETDLSTLVGDVMVQSATRTSYADSLVLDEEAGLATLTGSPARSVEGADEIQGEVLLYYLDTDDVVVEGGVSGTIELELR